MILKQEIAEESQESPGERLHKILDAVDFPKISGRSVDLYDFLNKHCEDWDLKIGTVRSWFSRSAPTMKKIVRIIELLDKHYGFPAGNELSAIEGWWKVGGPNPLGAALYQKTNDEEVVKLDFLLPTMIMKEIGEDEMADFSAFDLTEIKEFTQKFAQAFRDPNQTKCPELYLKMAICHALQEIRTRNEQD